MKNLFTIMALAMVILFTGCEKEEEVKVDPRLEYVGIYSLNVSGSASITNGSKTIPYDMSANNKNLTIELDQTDNSKLNVTGYYGSVNATIVEGYLCIDKYSGSVYTSGIYFVMTATHNKAKLINNKLMWTSDIQLAGFGSSTLYGYGTVTNTAIKQ